MNDIGRQVFRSGAYALLAMAFVLACSLLMPAEQAGTRMASRSHPTDLPAYSGSARYTVPEPGAGDE
jgi:hypothetical protein